MRRLSAMIRSGLILFAMAGWTNGQGMMNYTVNINFDKGNVSPTGSKVFTDYTEQGFRFFGDFGIAGGFESILAFPRNGGPYAFAFFDSYISVMPVNGVPFYLVSVDLAEFTHSVYRATHGGICWLPSGWISGDHSVHDRWHHRRGRSAGRF